MPKANDLIGYFLQNWRLSRLCLQMLPSMGTLSLATKFDILHSQSSIAQPIVGLDLLLT